MVSEAIFTEPEGRHILLSNQRDIFSYPCVQRIDLATGAAVEVQKPRHGILTWFADAQGVVRGGVEYGERRFKLYYRAEEAGPLRRVDTERYSQDGSVIDSVRFVSDARKGVILTNARTGRFAVYEYDFGGDAIGASVFEHPEVDVDSIIMGEDGVDGVAYEDDRPRVKWLAPDLAELQKSIDRTFPGKNNVIKTISRDRNVVLLWSGAADSPGTYYVFNRKAKRMEIFATPLEKLVGVQLSPVKAVSYAARDGLNIPAYLTLPLGRDAKRLPLILMPHGGPFARDSWGYDSQVQFLANRGYAVLQPNFRGSTGYGKDYVERGFGQFGAGMIDDMEDGVEWLARQGIIDPARVCIMGASYGGYAALWAPIRSPERYRCAISMAGVSDVRAMLKYDSRSAAPRRYIKEWKKRVEGEEKNDLAAISPRFHAARLRAPLLIAHGEKDTNVPPSQSKDMVKALAKQGIQPETVFYPEAEHGVSRPEDMVDFLKRVEAFLARHNPS